MKDKKGNPVYISIILSTYNEEKYIYQAIESVLNQSYPYFEFIIVNDGSTDGTLKIVQEFKDERIRIIDKKNTGLPDSLNVGIKASRYDWIARMDGDDIALPERLETQVSYISDTVGVIGGQFKEIDENGSIKNERISSNPLSAWKSRLYVILGWNPLAHPTALINKKYLMEIGGYDTNFIASQDVDLWSRLSSICDIINTVEPILLYRKHSNNISSKRVELQRRMSFLAYVKHGLKIYNALTQQQFNALSTYPLIERATKRNVNWTNILYANDIKNRKIIMYLYYLWKFCFYIKLRILGRMIRDRVL